jgi:nucleotide-binding universal stress UspA family protein
MTSLSRILAAIDFSKPARAAFDQALALSRRYGAELTVVHAVPATQSFQWRARARLALAAKLRRRAEGAGVRFHVSVQHGDPVGVILLHASALDPDLIVLGTHQRTGLDRLRTGSVAERVAVKATQPVLIVPPRRGADDVSLPFRHIAVAVDFSEASERAVDWGLALASDPGDRVTLVHVVPGFSEAEPPRALYRYGIAEYQRGLVRDARRRLLQAVPFDLKRPGKVHARVVTGDPATEVTRVANEIEADLVVAGVPRRNALSRGLFGVTVARLLRVVPAPMLAVPDRSGHKIVQPEHDQLSVAA